MCNLITKCSPTAAIGYNCYQNIKHLVMNDTGKWCVFIWTDSIFSHQWLFWHSVLWHTKTLIIETPDSSAQFDIHQTQRFNEGFMYISLISQCFSYSVEVVLSQKWVLREKDIKLCVDFIDFCMEAFCWNKEITYRQLNNIYTVYTSYQAVDVYPQWTFPKGYQ